MRYVLVLGTGRSGTSTTARILHQHLGVCMGHTFLRATGLKKTRNPRGFWEEITMTGWTKHLVKGISSPEKWCRQLDAAHNLHGCKSSLRGYKHPRLAEIPCREIWAALDPLLVIEARRPRDMVLRSMIFANPKRVDDCVARYEMRRKNLDRCLGAVRTFVINFDRSLSDDEVCEFLRPQIEGLR